MVRDGLMDRFGIDEIYGMHNLPGLPVGAFALCPGPVMAATDRFSIHVEGKGGHAAYPHLCLDPVLAGAQIVTSLQSIVSRNLDPLEACVISVTQFNAGTVQNAIPPSAKLNGTIRTLKDEVFETASRRIREVVAGVATAQGVSATVSIDRGYPVTTNDAAAAAFAGSVAVGVAGAEAVNTAMPPMMGAEDFSYMLQARPGAFLFTGNGDTAGLHNSAYDFNDEAIPYGVSFWVRLIETALPRH
jgi:amidohydrolase